MFNYLYGQGECRPPLSAATGTLMFYEGSTPLGAVTLSSGSAALSTSTLTEGNAFDNRNLCRRHNLRFQHIQRRDDRG